MSNRKYSILVVEGTGSERELCQVDTNPELIVEVARAATRKLGKRWVAKYDSVRLVKNTNSGRPIGS